MTIWRLVFYVNSLIIVNNFKIDIRLDKNRNFPDTCPENY